MAVGSLAQSGGLWPGQTSVIGGVIRGCAPLGQTIGMFDHHGLLFDIQRLEPGLAIQLIEVGRRAVARPELAEQQIDTILGLPDMNKLMNQQGAGREAGGRKTGFEATCGPTDQLGPDDKGAIPEGIAKDPQPIGLKSGVKQIPGKITFGSRQGSESHPGHDQIKSNRNGQIKAGLADRIQ